jgi:predicted dienelactone hydrolase
MINFSYWVGMFIVFFSLSGLEAKNSSENAISFLPSHPVNPAVMITKPEKVGVTQFEFFDSSRQRPLITEVWYPVDRQTPAQKVERGPWLAVDEARDAPLMQQFQKFPLILLSHVFSGSRFSNSWIASACSKWLYCGCCRSLWKYME